MTIRLHDSDIYIDGTAMTLVVLVVVITIHLYAINKKRCK